MGMKTRKDKIRKKKIKAAIEKVNNVHEKTLEKPGDGVGNKFTSEVNAFIERYRSALRRLAKK